jgi:hypothetical protein
MYEKIPIGEIRERDQGVSSPPSRGVFDPAPDIR